ncbi:hypothetical protein LTR50_006855 [Elasticomyces elasticus]|nr:hypothetical protein LTR50_006855 [Elasticomyces elasticus]
MAQFIGLNAVGWHVMVESWWDRALAGLALTALVLGLAFVVYQVWRKVKKSLRARRQRPLKVPAAVARQFDQLKRNTQQLRAQQPQTKPAKSLGVFLGGFADPPTPNQTRLLTRWDLVVVDPRQPGVLDAVTSHSTSTQILGRLDVGSIVEAEAGPGDVDAKTDEIDTGKALEVLARSMATQWKRPSERWSPCTGVLLANWHRHFPPVVCNELIKHLAGLNLSVYLEISPPTYLSPAECADIDMELLAGILCRNGTILSNGDRRNYFQMADMRRAQRALAKHASMRASTFMMWETLDDAVVLSHAVAKRSANWCRFNSASSWIGPESALFDAEVAAAKTSPGEPLGALMWLKSNEIMAAHDIWRRNDAIAREPCDNSAAYASLEAFIPDLAAKLSLGPPSSIVKDRSAGADLVIAGHAWPSRPDDAQDCPFSVSPSGLDYTGLGCFQLGLDCSAKDFADLLDGQRRLRDLDLLERLKPDELGRMRDKLLLLYDARNALACTPKEEQALAELLERLADCKGDDADRVKVYVGLHSGFHSRLDMQFWGLYDVNFSAAGCTDIFLSGKTADRVGAMLHTFLSSKQVPRARCLMAEMALASVGGAVIADPWGLPLRLVQDIEQLAPAESMLFLRRLAGSECGECAQLAAQMRKCCEYQLMVVPSVAQLRAANTSAYLSGEISVEELVKSRIDWFREQGCACMDPEAALALFEEVDARLSGVLMDRQSQQLARLESVLQTVLRKGHIDAGADIFALSVFCAFRKLAIDEVYLEVLDRNPLPNRHSDQAACFSEMFALGSQCESYFDMTSNALGRIVADKYHAYYRVHQPPHRDDKTTEIPTAYASKQVDEDPHASRPELPVHYQITFLGIFAVPALIDILLLTTMGRGLYLSTYMDAEVKTMATAGLMFGLLLCGTIGTWIGHGGSYYLHCMAYPAMNMFVLTRFIAGVAVCLVVGIGALIIIGIIKNFYAGFIFFFYFGVLSTYLTVLATLAIYQLPGFMFQSGRLTVVACLPLLAISPILTLWVHRDIVIYPCVLTGFLVSLLLGSRRVLAQWGSWYLHVPCVSDTEVVNWYTKTVEAGGSRVELPEGVTDLAATPLPRRAIMAEILKERSRRPWKKSTADEIVKRLADGYPATMFLMDWYCKYSRTEMPYPFSPTWNLQCKAAIDTLKDMQKGLKLHNAFIHWRRGGDEVWCGSLYFVVALMDKWISLVSGGVLVGLSAADSSTFRLAVGFGLAYYLIAAVCLDSVAQPLWPMANKRTNQPITSLQFLRTAAVNDARARRHLYWTNFAKFFLMHIWGFCVTAIAMWSFESSRAGTIMFMAYVGAYTGLLWYQYNRIYTGALAMADLVVAAVCGFVTGMLLRHFMPSFEYSSVVGLGVGTWLSALLSMRTANIGWPRFKDGKKKSAEVEEKTTFYGWRAHGPEAPFSQSTLAATFDSARALSDEFRYKVDPATHPGVEAMEILVRQAIAEKPGLVRAAFPVKDGGGLLGKVVEIWRVGGVVVELVPARLLPGQERRLRAVGREVGGRLHVMVLVDLDLVGDDWVIDVRRNCRIITEAVVQATLHVKLGLSYDHATLAALLVVDHDGSEDVSIPEGIKRQLETSSTERATAVKDADRESLRHMLVGLDCDREWDNLPKTTRSLLLKICCGEDLEMTAEQLGWIRARDSLDLEEQFARARLGAALTLQVEAYARALEADGHYRDRFEPADTRYSRLLGAPALPVVDANDRTGLFVEKVRQPVHRAIQAVRFAIKFFVVSLVADPEFQRELEYVVSGRTVLLRWPAKAILNGIWIYCKTLQRIIIPQVLLYDRESVTTLYNNMKGIQTVVEKNRVVIESLNGPSTGFFTTQPDGSTQFHQYAGRHDSQPDGLQHLMAVNTYTDKLTLRRREEYANQSVINLFTYEYPQDVQTARSTLPMTRECINGKLNGQIVQYDEKGHITSGSYIKDKNMVRFKLWYRKHARFDDELLRAEFILDHIRMRVSWCWPSPEHPDRLDTWIPYTKVVEATFCQGAEIYQSSWSYDHRSHPVITTTLNGKAVPTPAMIKYDWFGILQKPKNCSFLVDNPLYTFNSTGTNVASRLLGFNKRTHAVSCSLARTHLWKTWKNGKELDAVTVRWLDEKALRSDRILRPYWTYRDMGRLKAATAYLESQADAIMARTDMDPEVSAWLSLAYKYSDFSSFGQGGDTRINTRGISTQMQDGEDVLHILAMDTGTWPNEGGGVSACRRDMVNDLKTIRWHVLAESANDYGVPKFQIERNVQSLSVLPLWGLDFLTPIHGVFRDSLDSSVQKRYQDTRSADIRRNFLPILTSLVRCSRAVRFDKEHVEEATRALVDLNAYFEESRHWTEVWTSEIVKEKWRELWLCEDMENTVPISQWLDAECPTLLHLDNALDMWHRYLFIFSIPVPEQIPEVFQASHHFAGASYGVLCKVKRNCTLHVWDHCISWREVTVFLSSAMSFDSPFVCSSLIHLSRMTSILVLHYADVVLPCADFFNPGWEVEHGTQEGILQHRRTFARKIDPVVNGICNMEKFKPIEKIKSKVPTVVMLSHVRFVKDIKNAILAADIIVNEWGFTDYQLDIYGDMEKAPAYSVECKEILASKGLRDHVALRGLGSPSKVLEEAAQWLFLNSSISEGLPLAMGEAALTGVPVVCTDVGASFRVVTDPVTWKKFSAVVAPNDSYSLAKAQIDVLGLLDEWSEYADDAPGVRPKLSLPPTPEEVQMATERMYAKTEQRRRLGMLGRANVLSSFSSDRYLREHEQMLWIGKCQSPSSLARLRHYTTPMTSTYSLARPLEQLHRSAHMSTTTTLINEPHMSSSTMWTVEPKVEQQQLLQQQPKQQIFLETHGRLDLSAKSRQSAPPTFAQEIPPIWLV